MSKQLQAVSLFSGAGGFELGFERAGIRTVMQVENDPWCLAVLERHWPEVTRVDDVRKVDASSLQGRRGNMVGVGSGSDAERLGAARGRGIDAAGAGDGADGRRCLQHDCWPRDGHDADPEGKRVDPSGAGQRADGSGSPEPFAEHRGGHDSGGPPAGGPRLRDIDLVYGGFPCFTAGTLVLTEDGYRPIEDLVAGDRVLSHTGRWRAITSVMRRRADRTVILRGHGVLDVQTTDEHPFWSRRSGRRFIRRRTEGIHRSERTWTDPEWANAADMAGRHASQVLPIEPPDNSQDDPVSGLGIWGSPVRHGGVDAGGQNPGASITPGFWWLVGRYLADGWVTPSNGKVRVVICAAYKEADEVEERIRRCFPCTRDENRTTVKFAITRIGFARWLQQFGHRAFGKRIPGWVYSLSQTDADALLTGYLTGDGYYNPKRGWQFTSVSKPLALGIALLAQRARGVIASIGAYVPAERGDIEGRSVRQRPQYNVVIPDRHRSGFVEGNYGWKLIRDVRPAPGGEVFNISVEHDESYVADGCVVHNCQDVSVAGKRAGLSGERSSLWHEFHRVLRELRPRWCVIENVPGLLSSNSGRDFATVLLGLEELGYGWAYRILDARFFGIPQRRRRVFVVGYLGDAHRAAQVLAVCESCGGHPAPRDQTREDLAPALDDGARGASVGGGHPGSNMPGRHHEDDENLVIARSLTSRNDRIDAETENFAVAGAQSASDGHHGRSSPRGDGADNLITGAFYSSGGSHALHDAPTSSPAVKVGSGVGITSPPAIAYGAGVRRLTPLECERLMGWPDGHTKFAADGTEVADSHRYRLCGNGVVATVAEWLGWRLVLADSWGASR